VSKTVASVAIVLSLGLHAAPVLIPSEKGTLWPFMRWTMYKNSRGPGIIEAHDRRIIAVTESGRQDTITPDLMGLSHTVIRHDYLRPLTTGDSTPALELISRLNWRRTDSVVELRAESETYSVTDSGIVRKDNPVHVYRAAPAAGESR
jgi:hypothetical protein